MTGGGASQPPVPFGACARRGPLASPNGRSVRDAFPQKRPVCADPPHPADGAVNAHASGPCDGAEGGRGGPARRIKIVWISYHARRSRSLGRSNLILRRAPALGRFGAPRAGGARMGRSPQATRARRQRCDEQVGRTRCADRRFARRVHAQDRADGARPAGLGQLRRCELGTSTIASTVERRRVKGWDGLGSEAR